MPTSNISVRDVQQGLTYWASVESRGLTDDAPSPGRIDGRWGPRTHEALRAYVAYHAPRAGFDSARVLAPLRSVEARTTEIELEMWFVSRLSTHAVLYRSRPRGGGRPATPREEPGRVRPPPNRPGAGGGDRDGDFLGSDRESGSRSGSSGSFALLAGLLVAAAGTVAVVAWSRRSKQSELSDDEVYDDDALLETDWV